MSDMNSDAESDDETLEFSIEVVGSSSSTSIASNPLDDKVEEPESGSFAESELIEENREVKLVEVPVSEQTEHVLVLDKRESMPEEAQVELKHEDHRDQEDFKCNISEPECKSRSEYEKPEESVQKVALENHIEEEAGKLCDQILNDVHEALEKNYNELKNSNSEDILAIRDSSLGQQEKVGILENKEANQEAFDLNVLKNEIDVIEEVNQERAPDAGETCQPSDGAIDLNLNQEHSQTDVNFSEPAENLRIIESPDIETLETLVLPDREASTREETCNGQGLTLAAPSEVEIVAEPKVELASSSPVIIEPVEEVDEEPLDSENEEVSIEISDQIRESLLGPGSLFGKRPSTDESEDDLELEFDNEPPFKSRQVSLKQNQDPRQDYEFMDELGRGKFGTVFKCREKSTGLELAIKVVRVRRKEDRDDVVREISIMSLLQHHRLLQLYDAYELPLNNEMYMITEIVEGGELFERVIDDDFDLTEKKAAIFMRQICEGVDYMHNINIVHLDMKPENILCISRTSNRIKLIDFGLARILAPGEQLRVMFGTPDFAAPEVLSYDFVSFSADMWSVGVICYVLLSGLSPFMGDSDIETMANVTKATFDFESSAFDLISDLAKDFISKLLVRQPSDRLKPRECLEHPWLQRGGAQLVASVRSRRESMVSIMSARRESFDVLSPITLSGSLTSLDKRNLKKYVVRRKWHRTIHAIMALGRMGANLRQKLAGE